MKKLPLNYTSYLKLDALLSAQTPVCDTSLAHTHDEMLFIIVHQTFELWFKQILHELNSVLTVFSQNRLDDRDIFRVLTYLHRITEIQRVMVGQFAVLKTMTPMDFLEFRHALGSSSGLQSYQFRMIEAMLGVYDRDKVQELFFLHHLPDEQRELVTSSLQKPSLMTLIDNWLQRTPFLQRETFSFFEHYKTQLMQHLDHDESQIEADELLTLDEKTKLLQQIQTNRNHFLGLFDEACHQQKVASGQLRLSFKATLAALFICTYRDEPVLQAPFRLLSTLVDIDELFTQWRYNHVLMVFRMIGSKTGTGGTSGMEYLRKSAEKNKVFTDFSNLTTYLIPRTQVPQLPHEYKSWLGFNYI